MNSKKAVAKAVTVVLENIMLEATEIEFIGKNVISELNFDNI
jgi:hypothetical protein